MPVLPSITPQVSPVVPQVTASVFYNISGSNLYSSNMDLDKSSLLLSPELNTVIPCVISCIRPNLLSPTAKIRLR